MLNIKKELISNIEKELYVKVFLNEGVMVEGYVSNFDDDMILLKNKNVISGISLSSIHSWQVYNDKEQKNTPLKETISDEGQKENYNKIKLQEPFIDTYKKLYLFKESNDSILFRMNPYEPISKVPDFLKNNDDSCSRSIWDRVLAKINIPNVHKDKEIEQLSNEFATLLKKYPSQSILEYNLGCLKLKSSNYPSAANHFDNTHILSSDRKSLYNSIYAHLQAGNKEMVTLNLAKYLYAETNLIDNKFWFEFSCLCKESKEYWMYTSVVDSILNHIEDIENINLIFGSLFFVYEDVSILQNKFQENGEEIKVLNKDMESTIAVIQSFLDDVQAMDIWIKNDNFNIWMMGESTDLRSAKDTDITQNNDSSINLDYDWEYDVFRLKSLFNEFHYNFNRGSIYRCIPVSPDNKLGYGFLRDDSTMNEVHFFYDKVIGLQYLTTTVEINVPVLYMAVPTNEKNTSVDLSATIIIPIETLDNIWESAFLFAKEKDYESALNELNTILKYHPEYPGINDRKKKWEKLLDKNECRFKRNFNLNFKPKNEQDWTCYINTLFDEKLYSEAISYYDKISATPAKSSYLFRIGLHHYQKKDFNAAISFLTKAIDKNHFYYNAYFARGLVYFKIEKYHEALSDFARALDLRPDHKDVWVHYALSQQLVGKYDHALNSYEKAQAIDSTDWNVRSLKAGLYIKMNKISEALKIIDDILENGDPENPETLFSKGYALQKIKKYDEALFYFEKSLEIKPSNIKVITKKAYTLARLNRFDEALYEIDHAINMNHFNSRSWYYRGVINYFAGNFKTAKNDFEESLKLKPNVSRVESCLDKTKLELKSINDDENIKELVKNCSDKWSL
ncbi:tetratricopeptide repeat protein [Methanosalsum zhilinae]|uniref:tetratricopeptide repeat protein n=1 Tax=Methanosalsum zhilinae TaxID=39669 RepID=UPI000662977A|nr:tetratricopeptide repeat protein [Methanosalsum zhilinae]